MHQSSPSLRTNLYLILATVAMHGLMMLANELFIFKAEYLKGIGWIYLPAGTRLLCTLLFGRMGAIGLLLTGWAACYWYYFPGDVLRATTGAIAGAIGPYLVYLVMHHKLGSRFTLAGIAPAMLFVCAVGSSVASPLLHHIWFALHGDANLLRGFFVMFVGDLAGTLVVVFLAKGLLMLLSATAPAN